MKWHELLSVIPNDQLEEVFSGEFCDIDAEFMGFTEQYKALSTIIPKHFTIIDMGCAFAAQSYYFDEHKAYIGVDIFDDVKRFSTNNTTLIVSSIQEFIKNRLPSMGLDLETTFAICNYMPDFEAARMVRETFPNVFVFYPSGVGHYKKSIIQRMNEKEKI